MITFVALLMLLLGVVMFEDRNATFQRCFRGLLLVALSIVFLISILIVQFTPHDKTQCSPAAKIVM